MAGIFGLLMSGAGVLKDQYFNLTSLLLPGNGTNGAQNNTFLDSSTNNFTITRNGDTTQGTFSPFSQTGWGAYFDGSNDYATTPYSTTNFDWYTSGQDFTIEAWVFPTNLSTWQDGGAAPMMIGNGEPGGNFWSFGPISNGTVRFSYYNGSSSLTVTSSATVSANQWSHIAMTKTSSGISIFVNSVGTTATAIVGTPQSSTSIPLSIGRASNAYISGYVSNLRILKNVTPPYSGTSYTVPTSPLTAISGTKLLTLQSNRFLDNSSVANVITANNGVVITPFSPFAPTSSYSAAAVGGSGYFDGSGDYLTTPTGQTPLTIGTSSFTISFWFYCPAQVQTNGTLFASNASVTYTNAILSQFSSTAATTLELAMGGSIIKTGIAVVPNQWNFVVIQRTAPSTMQMWVNGNEVTGVTASSANLTDNDWRVAYWFTGAHALTGYISNFRIVKGTALYSGSTITVPTAPLGSTGSDTSLLLNFTNAGVVDATAKNVLETEGNAQISTAQSKWGGGSIYLDGTSNTAVKLLASNQLSPFSGDYTYEFWLYFNSFTGTPVIFDTRASSGAIPGLQIFCTTSGVLTVYGGSATATLLITGGTLSTGQWYYIALVRSGSGSNNTKLYLNGSQSGSSATDTTNYNNQGGYIGANAGSPSNYLNGYIDDFRFTRYARTIATPTAPFPVQ